MPQEKSRMNNVEKDTKSIVKAVVLKQNHQIKLILLNLYVLFVIVN